MAGRAFHFGKVDPVQAIGFNVGPERLSHRRDHEKLFT
jgi:hypothetical protein